MSWAEVFARFGAGNKTVRNYFYKTPYNNGYISSSLYSAIKTAYDSTVGKAARDAGIIIYAIDVEAPDAGLDAMQDYASSDAHYFDVDSDDLMDTFSSIVGQYQR